MRIVDTLAPEHLAHWSEPADLDVPCVRVAWKPDEVDMANLIHGGTTTYGRAGRRSPR